MTNPSYFTHTLPNGLRIIHHQTPSEISYCGIAVNTGTRDEYADEFGIAHFVEHMLFKGTKRRRAHHIANRMENVGGEMNAYTTKEETFFYATFLEEYFSRAAELLSDIVFHSEFPAMQIDREREVVLDEINSYLDFPSELIYDDFENMLFAGHDIGHYILGTPESLGTFDHARIERFVERQYHPSRMVFFSSGKTPFHKVLRYVENYFQDNPLSQEKAKTRTPPTPAASGTIVLQKNTSQSHVMIGSRAYAMNRPERYPLYLLNNVLGGGTLNSRLNRSLREKNGLVYNVESNVTFYSDTGLFCVYFACDPKYTDKCLRLVRTELTKLRNTPFTSLQLSVAKKQWKGQLGIAAESNENQTLTMAKNFLHFNTIVSLEEVFEQIEVLTAEQIQEVAQEILDPSGLFLLKYD